MSPEDKFNQIVASLSARPDVRPGPMMSSPGIKYKGKVFAFFHKEKMTFKLGSDFDPTAWSITEWEPLSPFKTKPPLKGWFVISADYMDKWEELGEEALRYFKS